MAGGSTTQFIYDQAGHMIAEANGSGTVQKEYIWLDDMPVAMVGSTGTSPVLYFIHTDQLGTPQKLTDGFMNVVWDGVFDPFGNPASGASVTLTNLRFPGQYFDSKSGLSQNWNRDYDSTTGRYVQSDPIGLVGGINTYAYVDGNPLEGADPLGLCIDAKKCKQLRDNINRKTALLEKELNKYNPALDAVGGFLSRWGITKPGGHYTEIVNLQRGIRNDINEYLRLLCDQDDDNNPGFGPVPERAEEMATRPVPTPQLPSLPRLPRISPNSMGPLLLVPLIILAIPVGA